ncbi:MAG: acetyl-CoA carboxylase biotin carboxylase subunit [Planctomycetota bacterium]|jgi:acetyl-CoA carboxylase biotin carboxylase subunit
MLRRVLIANRGEIALRIVRACKELGIETVCVYSEADSDAIYLRLADESICIGPANAALSYLDIPRVISAAEIADVEGIHPGYGFLAENAQFADVCRSCGIRFIGPSPEAMNMMADKAAAREAAIRAEVPVIPGSHATTDPDEALQLAKGIGFPVMIKAVAGGGGRGMRLALSELAFVHQFQAASAEAEAAFKNGKLYLEKYIEGARHVEIQVLADRHGNVIHLGERDCSVQRRHQKLVEESPSPAVSEELRSRMGEASVRLTRSVGYENAGTIEYLVDKDLQFYFIEMNTRLQVEHPVTEMVTGIDIVKEQLRIAAGMPLSIAQDDVRLNGHAIEVRINAEDPARNFAPQPGRVDVFFPPTGAGIRVDSHAYGGYRIPPNYDSLIGKLIVHAPDRKAAMRRLRGALQCFLIDGVKTTIPFHLRLLSNHLFQRGQVTTSFVEDHLM